MADTSTYGGNSLDIRTGARPLPILGAEPHSVLGLRSHRVLHRIAAGSRYWEAQNLCVFSRS
jgi:hypothetical protein